MPWAIKRTPERILGIYRTDHRVAAGFKAALRTLVNPTFSRLRLLMHVARERLDVLDRRHRQDAVAEIEDVSRPSARARQHVVGRREHAIERAEQQRRIEVALDRAVEADALPGFVERRPPVGADHVAAGVAQLAENRARADAEMNRRHAVRCEPPRRSCGCAAG